MHKLDSARNKLESIISSYSGCLMSVSKWVKVFDCIRAIEDSNRTASAKLVWDEEVRDLSIDDSLQFGLDYYGASMESMLSGYPKGFYDYKELEWVEFHSSDENLDAIEKSLNKLGQFELERTASGVKLFAYQ